MRQQWLLPCYHDLWKAYETARLLRQKTHGHKVALHMPRSIWHGARPTRATLQVAFHLVRVLVLSQKIGPCVSRTSGVSWRLFSKFCGHVFALINQSCGTLGSSQGLLMSNLRFLWLHPCSFPPPRGPSHQPSVRRNNKTDWVISP